jgi:hypothetical protein
VLIQITLWTQNTYIESKTNYRQALEEKHINAGKQTNIQTNKDKGFISTIDLNKEKCISFYVRKADLIFQAQKYSCMGHDGKSGKDRRTQTLLNTLELVGISGSYRVPNN